MSNELVASPYQGVTEQDTKIANAVELVFSGLSVRKAAAECGVAPTTLHRAIQADTRYMAKPEREAAIAEAKAEAIAIRREAARITLEGLHSGEIPATQAPIVYGIANDKMVKIDQMEKGQNHSAGDILERMLQQGGAVEIKLQAPDKAIQARDVTPQTEDES